MKNIFLLIAVLFTLAGSAQRVTNYTVQKDDSIIRVTQPKLTMTNKDSNVTIFQDRHIIEVIKKKGVATVPPVVDPPSGNYGTLIYSNNFESNSDLDPFGHGQASSGSISSEQKFAGSRSFKAVVGGNTSSGWRSEIQLNDEQSPMNTDLVYEWYVFLSKAPTTQGLMGQWHAKPSGTSANGGYFRNGSGWQLVRNLGGSSIRDGGSFNIPTGEWAKIRVEVRFTTSNNGYWRTYVNDKLVSDIGTKRTAIDNNGQYFKLGFNWFSNPGSSLLGYFDELKIWRKN